MVCFYLHWHIDRVCVCPELKKINPVIPQNSLELWESSICSNVKKKITSNNIDITKKEYPAAVLNAVIAKATKRITYTN